ncbi:MAG: hypothetical protein GTO16_04430 [Candidatus Aminicenantes bacterium]|nr:hypothetical protein [Candidatus Aminicenantes bacterium]
MQESKPTLPKTIRAWTRPDSPQLVTAKSIFDYMDGAGELYIGYRFDHLESYEYKAKDLNNILVEVYFMKTSDDAFGLLSLDWEGEPLNLAGEPAQIAGKPVRSGKSPQSKAAPESSSWPRALYGEGLLRLWSDTVYARIMAHQETPESKEAVLALGRSIIKDRENPPPPKLLQKLPDTFPEDWVLGKERTSYFRSHLVLNSIYYLGQENMLNLDLSSEAIASPYEKKDSEGIKRIHFLLVKYSDHKRARQALGHFHNVYLPEHPIFLQSDSSGEISNMFLIEDGWLGYKIKDETIAFIFECPDQKTARTIINQI